MVPSGITETLVLALGVFFGILQSSFSLFGLLSLRSTSGERPSRWSNNSAPARGGLPRDFGFSTLLYWA